MDEADLRRHLARQTSLPIGLVDLVAMKAGRARGPARRGARARRPDRRLDVVDDETLADRGQLIWETRDGPLFAVGSQGVEYALVAHWRAAGLIPTGGATAPRGGSGAHRRRSGSCSPVTAGQIAWAEAHGFAGIAVDAARAVDETAWSAELARATAAALAALADGRDPLVYTAAGADDPAVAALRAAVEAAGADEGASTRGSAPGSAAPSTGSCGRPDHPRGHRRRRYLKPRRPRPRRLRPDRARPDRPGAALFKAHPKTRPSPTSNSR